MTNGLILTLQCAITAVSPPICGVLLPRQSLEGQELLTLPCRSRIDRVLLLMLVEWGGDWAEMGVGNYQW